MDFSPASLFVNLVFGTIGLAAWQIGRRKGEARPMVLGLVLMGYSWFIEDPLPAAGVGVLLTVLVFWP